MSFDASRVCRICLEEGALSSVFSGNFTMSLGEMIELCSNVKITKEDSMPSRICSNCIYKLSVAYHFKQQCESSDLRLRQYLGLSFNVRLKDAAVMTEEVTPPAPINLNTKCKCRPTQVKKKTRYKRKPESEKLKRGPKPKPKPDHTCYECSKQFKCRAQLDMHIRTHTGDRPYACVYCPRRFTQKHNLDIHARLHTGEKPYQCEVCSKRFTAQGNLQTHLKIHLGQRDQICSVCKKGFITSSELTRHMGKHRGVKDFKCDICGVAFVQSRDLKSHKQKKHQVAAAAGPINEPRKEYTSTQMQLATALEPSKKHECVSCGESFHYLQLLSQHCALKHPFINAIHPRLQ